MNKLLENLLVIHERIASVETFINIKMRVESLNTADANYQKLVEDTDLLVRVLTKFGEQPVRDHPAEAS